MEWAATGAECACNLIVNALNREKLKGSKAKTDNSILEKTELTLSLCINRLIKCNASTRINR
jgi:hypothetical protein